MLHDELQKFPNFPLDLFDCAVDLFSIRFSMNILMAMRIVTISRHVLIAVLIATHLSIFLFVALSLDFGE